MTTPLYVPITLNDGPNSGLVMVPFTDTLPVIPMNNRVLILEVPTGVLQAGLYAYSTLDQVWRFEMPMEALSLVIVNSETAALYINVTASVTLPNNAVVYRNGVLTTLTVIPANDTVGYAVRIPQQSGGSGTVSSVNNVLPDSFGNINLTAANISGLAAVAQTGNYADLIDAPAPFQLGVASASSLGGVIVPATSQIVIDPMTGALNLSSDAIAKLNGALTNVESGSGGVSLVSAVTGGVATLKPLIAGTNVTITDNGAAGLVIASTGGGGAQSIELTGDVTGISDAQGQVATTLAASGVAVGTYNKVTVDAKGRVTVGQNATTLADLGVTTEYLPLTGGSMSGAVAFTAGTVTGLPAPVVSADAANKAYVDSQVAAVAIGVFWHNPVVAASVQNMDPMQGLGIIDGRSVEEGDRVLLKNQSDPSENGVYIATSGFWNRAPEENTGASIFHAAVLVLNGDVNGLTQWINTNDVEPVLGTTPLTFGQLQGATTVYTASGGVQITGLNFSLVPTGVGPGTYTRVTVDATGRVTAGAQLSNAEIVAAIGYTPYDGATNPNGYISGTQALTFTGSDVTGTGTLGSPITLELAATGVSPGTYTSVTVDAKGRVTLGGSISQAQIISALTYTPVNRAGDTMSGALNSAPPVTVAAAATTNIGAAASNDVAITGTATITAFDTIAAGAVRSVQFGGVLTLTNSNALLLPSRANIVTAVGDCAEFVSLGSGNWRCNYYTRADGTAVVAGGAQSPFSTTQVFNGSTTQPAMKIKNAIESGVVVGANPTLIEVANGSMVLSTANATANWTYNFRWSSTLSMASALAIGDSVTVAVVTQQGASAFRPTAFQIDGVAVTPIWQGGTAPTSGNPSGRDVYTFTIIKQTASAYVVLAAQTQYK